MWEKDIFLPSLIGCYFGFPSLAAELNLNKTSVFLLYQETKSHITQWGLPGPTDPSLAYLFNLILHPSSSCSLHLNPTHFSHAAPSLKMLVTWMAPAHHWGLSPCVPFLEEHSLTKLLLFFSFLIVPFPDSFSLWKYIFYCTVICLLSSLLTGC